MQYFVAGLAAADAVSMAAVKVAGIEKLGREKVKVSMWKRREVRYVLAEWRRRRRLDR